MATIIGKVNIGDIAASKAAEFRNAVKKYNDAQFRSVEWRQRIDVMKKRLSPSALALVKDVKVKDPTLN